MGMHQIMMKRRLAVLTSYKFLLNEYPSTGYAFDLFKISSTATNCVRVRRSSDSVEQDIGFDGNQLDTADLLSFIGANDGFVTKWYDQSGNTRDAFQATAANQPKIVNAGALITEGGKPVISFDGTNDFMQIPATGLADYANIFSRCKLRDTGTVVVILELSNNYNNFDGSFLIYREFGSPRSLTVANKKTPGGTYLDFVANEQITNFSLYTVLIDRVAATPNTIYKDGVLQTLTNGLSATVQGSKTSNLEYYLGARSGSVAPSQLNISNLILYNVDKSTERADIELLINQNY